MRTSLAYAISVFMHGAALGGLAIVGVSTTGPRYRESPGHAFNARFSAGMAGMKYEEPVRFEAAIHASAILHASPLDPAFDGNQARNVPYNSANLWTRYNFVQNECATAGTAIGLVYLGERPADLFNTLDLPGFNRWDAGLYYSRGQFTSAVYLENLFDLQYAATSINTNQIILGAPFATRATGGWIF